MKTISMNDIPEEGVSHDPQLRKKVIIRDGELPHLNKFAQARFAPGQVAHAHSHEDFYEIFLIESGEGIIKVNGSAHPISEGMCVIFEPEEVHEVINTGSSELVITYFGLKV